MNQLSPTSFDTAQLNISRLAEIALASDLADLVQRAEAVLASALPDHAVTIIWAADRQAPTLDEASLARLRAGEVTPGNDDEALVPLRASDRLVGWIVARPGGWSPEQGPWLQLLAAILASSYLALHATQTAPSPLEQRRMALRDALDRLRGTMAIEPLLAELSGLIVEHMALPAVYWMLRYRGSDWAEMSYLRIHEHGERPGFFVRLRAGLSSSIIKEGQPIETDDYVRACTERGISPLVPPGLPRGYAWLGIPLRDRGEVLGALVVFNDDPAGRLAPDDRTLLFWLADEVAGKIRGAQRYERAAEEASQRAALNRITRTITSSLDPERVPALIVEQAPLLLNAEESSLLLLDECTGELEFRYAAGPAGHRLLGQRVPAGKGVAGFVVSSGQPTIVNDTQDDARFYRDLDSDSGFQTRSIVAVPLQGIDGVKGVIEVLNRRDNAPFTDDDRALLEALADQAVIALENARRFASVDQALTRRAQELDRSNDRLRKILRASNTLRSERQVDALTDQIANVVSESSGFRSASIALVARERTPEPYLRLVAAAGPTPPPLATSVPLARLNQLLRPELRRSSLTYLLAGHAAAELGLFPPTVDVAHGTASAAHPDAWQANDRLICLLRDSHGELIGLLALDDPEDGARPGPEHVQILEILANQAASAIENAYLYAAQQHSLSRMMALNGLGRALSTNVRSPQQVFALTASGMLEMSGARWATVFLGDPDAPTFAAAFHTGAPRPTEPAAEQLARQASSARRPLSHHPSPSGEGMLAIPLRGSSNTLGAICIGFGNGMPDTGDAESLVLFASQAAAAVESLHLLAQVRQGRDQLASIMASTREGVLLVTEAGQIAVANGAFYELVGVREWPTTTANFNDLADLPISDLLEHWQAASSYPPVELARLASAVAAVSAGHESFVLGQLNGRGPGARSLEWSILRATDDGAAAAHTPAEQPRRTWPILLTVRDITAAKETERLRQDLTNMMVHDLRSPLTSIITSIDMIFRGVSGNVSTQQREILAIAYASAQSLLNMINLLLDISRLEGGRMPLEHTRVAPATLVQRALERVRALARNKQITINDQIDPAVSHVHADAELVLRVLQNLIDNALKFSPTGSQVTLHVSADGPAAVRFSVKDTGIGIKPGDLEKIFTKFGQAGGRRHAGSGLGLTFCKLVVEAHEGRIWVESTYGEGSTFHFTLPASAEASATWPNPKPAPA